MPSKPLIIAGIVLLAASSGGAPAAKKGPSGRLRGRGGADDDEPEIDPQTGEVEDPGETGDDDPIEPTVDPPSNATPTATYDAIIRPTPIPNGAYQVRKGDVFGGANGLIASALTVGYGRIPTPQERQAYYAATTRELTNFALYGVEDKTGAKVAVTDENGDTIMAAITSAMLKMHDSWPRAMAEQEMPVRLVGFSRGPKDPNKPNSKQGKVQPLGGWQNKIHGLPRSYGVVHFPSMDCLNVANPYTDPRCDWPPQLFQSLGIQRRTAV